MKQTLHLYKNFKKYLVDTLTLSSVTAIDTWQKTVVYLCCTAYHWAGHEEHCKDLMYKYAFSCTTRASRGTMSSRAPGGPRSTTARSLSSTCSCTSPQRTPPLPTPSSEIYWNLYYHIEMYYLLFTVFRYAFMLAFCTLLKLLYINLHACTRKFDVLVRVCTVYGYILK